MNQKHSVLAAFNTLAKDPGLNANLKYIDTQRAFDYAYDLIRPQCEDWGKAIDDTQLFNIERYPRTAFLHFLCWRLMPTEFEPSMVDVVYMDERAAEMCVEAAQLMNDYHNGFESLYSDHLLELCDGSDVPPELKGAFDLSDMFEAMKNSEIKNLPHVAHEWEEIYACEYIEVIRLMYMAFSVAMYEWLIKRKPT